MSDLRTLERTLWAAAEKLRKNRDATEYKHIVLSLIFQKYISGAFSELHNQLVAGKGEFEGADPEDKYLMKDTFFVPKDAHWNYLLGQTKPQQICSLIDKAMDEIEQANDLHEDKKTDFIFTNPPLSISNWRANGYGKMPAGNMVYRPGNANYA